MIALMTLVRLFPLRVWAALGVAALILILCAGLAYQTHRADRTTEAAHSSRVTTKALDHVATQTPMIRNDQEEKQREVDQIPGADQRLPDGFGRDLERVRQRGVIPDSLRSPCESTVDVSAAQTVGDLGKAIIQDDADLRVCDVRRDAVVAIADSRRASWFDRLRPG